MKIRLYESQFKALLESIYKKNAYFSDFYGGEIEALNGTKDTDTAFTVKLKSTPLTINEYNTDENVGMGTGTSNSNRFGTLSEVKYSTKDVPYSWTWALNRAIDRHTVNEEFDEAILDEIEDQVKAKINMFDKHGGAFISESAGKTLGLVDYSNAAVLALFDQLSEIFADLEVVEEDLMAWVTPKLYNAIVNHPDATNNKNSSANIDKNTILEFKGFAIKKTPTSKFLDVPAVLEVPKTKEIAYVSLRGIGKQFTGINTARTMEAFDFDGVALQGSGKAGQFIADANKKAVIKVVEGAVTPEI